MQALDLNLVRVFVAIHEAGSVTLAADRLEVTQPTVSYGLAKLRERLGDRLFVRRGKSLAPTPLAEQVYQQFSSALASIEGVIEDPRGFDPARSTRRFRIALSDIGSLYFLSPLLARLQPAAPHIELDITQTPVEQLPDALAAGTLDLAIGHLPSIQSQTRSALLFSEHYVCLMARSHPLARRGLKLASFAAARHASVVSPFSGHRMIDDALAQQGIKREIALRIPHFSVLPQLISETGLLVVLPSRVAALFASQAPVVARELPVKLPAFEVRVHWHAGHEASPPHKWLLDEVRAAIGGL